MASNLAAQATALVTLLGGITGATASKGDYRILLTATSYAFVLWLDTAEMGDIGMGGVWGYDHVITADAFIRNTGDPATWGALTFTLVDSVLDALDGNETLDGTVQSVTAAAEFRGEVEISGTAWMWMVFRFPTQQF